MQKNTKPPPKNIVGILVSIIDFMHLQYPFSVKLKGFCKSIGSPYSESAPHCVTITSGLYTSLTFRKTL